MRLYCIAPILFFINTVTLVTYASAPQTHHRQAEASPKQQQFGIELSPPARRLLAEVERYYGQQVREEVAMDWDSAQLGYSFVTDDGTPVIQINNTLGRKEEIIVHELFHLKLRARGFYVVNFNFSSMVLRYRYASYCMLMLKLLHAPIEHSIFYPEMRKAGFDPSATLKNDFKRERESGSLDNLQAGTIRALMYFRAMIEFDNPKLLSELTEFYRNKGWNDSIEIGKRLAQFVLKAKPHTPDEEIKVFLQCLNYILEGKARFVFSRVENRTLGRFTQRIAMIEVEPV